MFCCNGGAASLSVGSIGNSGVVVEIVVVGDTCLPPKKLIILIHEGVKEGLQQGRIPCSGFKAWGGRSTRLMSLIDMKRDSVYSYCIE